MLTSMLNYGSALAQTNDNGIVVDQNKYMGRLMLSNFTEPTYPNTARDLTLIHGNLYRHTSGSELSLHSCLVLINTEGALIIEPAMRCTAT